VSDRKLLGSSSTDDRDNTIVEYNPDPSCIRRYVFGPGVDEPVCMLFGMTNSLNTRYYYHRDGLGSPPVADFGDLNAESDSGGAVSEDK
jgi:hypothetical protein